MSNTTKYRIATIGVITLAVAVVFGVVAVSKPEAAAPLIWLLVAVGMARVSVALYRRIGRRQLAPARARSVYHVSRSRIA